MMKGNMKLGIGLLIFSILAIALIQAGQKEPINLTETYNPKDKIPYGTYVIRNELKRIFENNKKTTSINQSLFTYWDQQDIKKAKEDFIFVGTDFNPGEPSEDKLLEFVKEGNNALIATYGYSDRLQKKLGIRSHLFSDVTLKKLLADERFEYVMQGEDISAIYEKQEDAYYFSTIPQKNTTILGWLKVHDSLYPNFIRIQYGKGNFYLQTTPPVYANYYVLQQEAFPIAYYSLKHLNGEKILWYDDSYAGERVQTPLRFILSQPALRAAWYLLLFALVMFLVFKSKREQAAIPIVEPEQNMSVAFAETIGSLYYENGHPGNMIEKKISYFLYNLKKDYGFDEVEIIDKRFRQQAQQRLQLPEGEINAFFDQLYQFKSNKNPDTNTLKQVQELIENFKQKIK